MQCVNMFHFSHSAFRRCSIRKSNNGDTETWIVWINCRSSRRETTRRRKFRGDAQSPADAGWRDVVSCRVVSASQSVASEEVPVPTFRQSSNIDSVEIAGGLELVIVGGVNWRATRETYRPPSSYDSIWRGMQLRRGDDNQKVLPFLPLSLSFSLLLYPCFLPAQTAQTATNNTWRPCAGANALLYFASYNLFDRRKSVRGLKRSAEAGALTRPGRATGQRNVNAPLYAPVQLVNTHASAAAPRRACPSSVNW